MHPLMDDDLAVSRIKGEGLTAFLADPYRGTGRTTSIALNGIALALASPNTPRMLFDHHKGQAGQDALFSAVYRIRGLLGLRHVSLNKRRVVAGRGLYEYGVEVIFGEVKCAAH